ncbi:MAG: hypothetical protein PHY77_07680 [Desulfotomaculaceae bacterium]|nr:hypothetical protein [Desulfotomaculaceae bacterium]
MRNKALLSLVILAAVISFLVFRSLNKHDQYTALYNPVKCQEISYLHDQLASYLKNKTGNPPAQTGAERNQDNRMTRDLNNLNLPALKNSARFVEIAFFYLADDDINFVLSALSSAK